MKKKICVMLVVMAMAVSMIACGSKESDVPDTFGDTDRKDDFGEIVGNDDVENKSNDTISDEVPTETEENKVTGVVEINDYSDLKMIAGGMEIIPEKTTLQEILDYGERFGGYELFDEVEGEYIDADTFVVGAGRTQYYITLRMAAYDTKQSPDFRLDGFANNSDEDLSLKDCVVKAHGSINIQDGYCTYSEGEDGIFGYVLNETTYDEIVSDIGEPDYIDNFDVRSWKFVDKNGNKLGTMYLTFYNDVLVNVTYKF